MYKLYKELLKKRSGFFEAVLSFPGQPQVADIQGGAVQDVQNPQEIEDGTDDRRAIRLDRYQPHSAVDFESLLNFIHTPAS